MPQDPLSLPSPALLMNPGHFRLKNLSKVQQTIEDLGYAPNALHKIWHTSVPYRQGPFEPDARDLTDGADGGAFHRFRKTVILRCLYPFAGLGIS